MGGSILHITNGDSTTNYLKKLKFKGEFITWREMLCEGKTTIDVGSESFWKNRYDFFKSSYKVSKQKFIDYTIKEYRNLCNEKQQKEIVLWFEYDLFCQINMIAVISWLKRYRKGHHISLVCSGKVGNSKRMYALPELNEKQIQSHFKNRMELTQDDIEYADYIWQLYCSDSPLRLETVYKFNPMSPFQYLTSAIEAHLLRFPSIANGLNKVENTILETALNKKPTSKNELISQLLKDGDAYGFGDLQYENKINDLRKLFHSFNPVKLSKKGKEVLENQINYYGQIRNDISYLGGSKKYSFLYHNQSNKLLQITS
ncbi:DUF1835 domain-containing protein [Polaribacter reichenbachii]|uniref:DUF1835 domain-containing protein n=1 Tax=Polaribacter reichenbachii TaxID=996801 RepID=A0A1B8TPS6_9FLAO|nr:DUF1835 domain-containing protein [Polaribacter reichenbachii]APZ46884.1 DUF1835 domain-containing protein [Polaribacter reichenbachii]AUC17527.1 DUF1835 domain-containing protein [Polaribacter reichenbachii]OBY61599.1 hypothetical protein LPB301_16190 [Polaribacter reichenbachii]